MLQKSALFYPRQVRAGWRRFYNIMQLSLASKRITRIPWKSCQYNIIHLTAFGGRGKALECNFSRRILYVEHKNWQILISDSGECGRPRLMAVGDANHKADQGSVKETWLGGYSCSSKDERKGIFDPLSMTLCRISQRVLTIHGARRHIWIWSTQKGWLCWARWTGCQIKLVQRRRSIMSNSAHPWQRGRKDALADVLIFWLQKGADSVSFELDERLQIIDCEWEPDEKKKDST